MVEGFDSAVLDQGPCISNDSTSSTADMRIDLENLLNGFGDNERGVKSAFNGKDDSLVAFDADG